MPLIWPRQRVKVTVLRPDSLRVRFRALVADPGDYDVTVTRVMLMLRCGWERARLLLREAGYKV